MLSIDKSTFDDTRAIKVLVVPIGENTLFDVHFQTISVTRDTSVKSLTKPSSWTKENNQGFKYFDWSQGNLLFDYLRYDRVPNGPGDLDEFQSSRRVLMIIGLINYPELEENPAEKIQQELEYFTRRHPNVILRRLFLFNYPFTEGKSNAVEELLSPQLQGKISDPGFLVVFPPNLTCEGGSMVNVHLRVNIDNAACQIIGAFGDQMRICETAAKKSVMPDKHYQISLSTFYDDIEERKASRNSTEARSPLSMSLKEGKRPYQKKPGGRIRKWMGDLSMQVCSPRDALEHYQASIDVSRSLGDDMWLAGALEGYAAAILLAIKLEEPLADTLSRDVKALGETFGGAHTSIVVKALMVAEERAAEAIHLYSKSVVFCGLEVECSLRVAKMQEMIGIHKTEGHPWYGREQRAMAYILHATSVPGLNVQQQVECMIEGALVCKRLRMKRKYAFLLYLAAIMSAESDNMSMAHALLRNACTQYGIFTAPRRTHSNLPSVSVHGEEPLDVVVRDPSASWGVMRRQLMCHSAKAAHDSGDMKAATHFMAAALRLMVASVAQATVDVAHWASALGPPEERSHLLMQLLKEKEGGSAGASRNDSGDKGIGSSSTGGKEEGLASLSPSSTHLPMSRSLGGGRARQVVDEFFVSASSHALSTSPMGGGGLHPEAGGGGGRPSTSSGAASFLSQIGLGSNNASGSSELEASFSGSMMAMLSSNSGSGNTPSTSGAMSFASYSSHQPDVELRPTYGPYATRAHSLSFQAKLAAIDDTRIVGLPLTLQSLELPHGPDCGLLSHSSSIAGDVHGKLSFNSLLQTPPIPRHHAVEVDPPVGVAPLTPSGSAVLVPPPTPRPVPAPGAGDRVEENDTDQGPEGAALDFLSEEFVTGLTQVLGCSSESALPSQKEQDVTVQWLVKLSQELAPAYAVALPNLLVSLRPSVLPDGVRPEEVVSQRVVEARDVVNHVMMQSRDNDQSDVPYESLKDGQLGGADRCSTGSTRTSSGAVRSSKSESSSLFYDPFAERDSDDNGPGDGLGGDGRVRGGRGRDDHPVWSTHTLCHVVATFYNPLSCPLHFTSAKIRLEGCAHTSYDTSVLVPARCQHHEVEFVVMPLAPGSLRVVGLDVQVHAASYSFEVDSQGFSVSDLHETCQPRKYSRAVTFPTPRDGTVFACSAPFRGIRENADYGEPAPNCDGDISKLRGASTAVIDIVSSGPTIELEACGDGTNAAPLHLHHGERRKEWLRVKPATGAHVASGGESNIVDMRLVAVTALNKPATGAPSVRKSVLMDFKGALSEESAGQWSASANTKEKSGKGACSAPCEVVRVCRVALLPEKASVVDLNAAEEKTAELPVQFGRLTGSAALYLELEWTHVPDLASVELIIEVIGGSDPGYASLEALAQAMALPLASATASTEQLVAAMPQCQQFIEAKQTVFCRRASLSRPILSIPSLETTFFPLEGELQTGMAVLQLRNQTNYAMMVASSTTQVAALEEDEGADSRQNWVTPSSVALVLPPLSFRNVLLPLGDAGSVPGSLQWRTLPERREGEVALHRPCIG